MAVHATDLVRSAGAGLVATVPMSAAMAAMFGRLPWHERYSLPPRLITRRLLESATGQARPPEEVEVPVAWLSHFAYGTGAGLVYGLLPSDRRLPPVMKGIAYGLAIWSGSYLGWLPAARVLPPATRHPPRRTALMIAAHVVWGATLGALAGDPRLRRRRRSRARERPPTGIATAGSPAPALHGSAPGRGDAG